MPLFRAIFAAVQPVETPEGTRLYRWEDPSGARMTIERDGDEVISVIPSFAVSSTVAAGRAHLVGRRVVQVEVLDETPEGPPFMTFELERPQDFAARAAADSGDMFLTTFGTDVIFYENAASFSSSTDSLLTEDGSDADLPRIGAESYLSFGGAEGLLHGTVMSARVLTNSLTGQAFAAATVRSAGFSLEVCLPWSADLPAPSVGSLIGGDVYLIATLPGVTFQIVELDGPVHGLPVLYAPRDESIEMGISNPVPRGWRALWDRITGRGGPTRA